MTDFHTTSLYYMRAFAVHGAHDRGMLIVDLENMVSARIQASGRPTLFGPLDAVPVLRVPHDRYDTVGRRLACRSADSLARCNSLYHIQRWLAHWLPARIPARDDTTDNGLYHALTERHTAWISSPLAMRDQP